MFQNKLKNKAKRAREVMEILGVKAESRKQIAEALCMEILAEEFDMQDKYSKSTFVKTQGLEVMDKVRKMLEDEGALTKKIEKK